MAKIGYLYLRNGFWNGRQIIPKKWVKESTQKHISVPSGLIKTDEQIEFTYGYQWWVITSPEGYTDFLAGGSGGQFMRVSPYRNLVVVMTSDTRGSNYPHAKIFPSIIDASFIE